MIELTERDKRRFWSKVDKTPGFGPWGDCWRWRGTVDKNSGYGRFPYYDAGRKKLTPRAHRLSYVLNKGPVPEGLSVLHLCDERTCVLPAHLTAGSRAANSLDMLLKGRHGAKRFYSGEQFGPAVRFRLAEIATSRGLSLATLTRISGLPAGAVMHLWYNRTPTVNLLALARLTEILEVSPGDLFASAV